MLLVLCGTLAQAEGLDAAIVRELLPDLYEAALAENTVLLQTLSDEILSYDPAQSDALYASASLTYQNQAETKETLRRLETAVDADNWAVFSAHDAYVLLAEVYFRTRSYQKAIEAVEHTVPLHREGYYASDRLFELYVRSQYRIGNPDAADAALTRGLGFFSHMPTLQMLHTEQTAADDVHQTAYWQTRQIESADDLRLLEHFLQNVEREELFVLLYPKYRTAGGDDLALLLRGEPSDSKLLLATLAAHTLRYEDIALLQSYHQDHPIAYGNMVQMLSNYARILSDVDKDGFFEQEFILDRTKIDTWIIDKNQDGRSEYVVEFSAGLPSRFFYADDAQQGVVNYRQYPVVQSIQRMHAGGMAIYGLRPDAYVLPVLDYLPYHRLHTGGGLSDSFDHSLSIFSDIQLLEPLALPSLQDIIMHSSIRYVQEGMALDGYMHGEKVFSARYDEQTDQITELLLFDQHLVQQGIRDGDGDSYVDVVQQYAQNGFTDETAYIDGSRILYTKTYDGAGNLLSVDWRDGQLRDTRQMTIFTALIDYLKDRWARLR